MSQAHIEQFSSRVKNDPAIFNQLVEGAQTPDEFIDKAVALATETGFTFSREEADGWIKNQIEAKANGELSDSQLEVVAGGKGLAQPTVVNNSSVINVLNAVVRVGTPSIGSIPTGPWLTSW